jgi:NCS1 family nucleobase:cation symporter-1
VLGPIFGIIVSDHYLIKHQDVAIDDLYSMAPSGSLHYRNGWNPAALAALRIAGLISIGLALLGAHGIIVNVGDWGWLIGASLGGLLYFAAARTWTAKSAALAAIR